MSRALATRPLPRPLLSRFIINVFKLLNLSNAVVDVRADAAAKLPRSDTVKHVFFMRMKSAFCE